MVCGGLRWCVVVCGGLWWFVVDCGGLSFSHTALCSRDVKVVESGVFDVDHCHWHHKMVPFSQ